MEKGTGLMWGVGNTRTIVDRPGTLREDAGMLSARNTMNNSICKSKCLK